MLANARIKHLLPSLLLNSSVVSKQVIQLFLNVESLVKSSRDRQHRERYQWDGKLRESKMAISFSELYEKAKLTQTNPIIL